VSDLLLKENISSTVVNARFVKPLDEKLIEGLINKHKFIFTFEDGSVEGGFGSAILEKIQNRSICRGVWPYAPTMGKCEMYTFGLPCEFITFGKREELFDLCGLLPEQIVEKIVSLMKR
jgi:1-deoxy-D-xylulose-5-phosphate synthase